MEMGKHLIKHKSENIHHPDRLCFYFILNLIFVGEIEKWRYEDYKRELGCCTCRLNRTEKIRPQREWEALYNVLGSVLVLGWGSWAEVGKCLCGFVWIIIRVLCGWATACTFLLLYASVCLCVHCEGGCATAAALLFPLPLRLPPTHTPTHPHGADSKLGQIALCCSCIWRWPVES